jgi:SAM-dependent methyltransferase
VTAAPCCLVCHCPDVELFLDLGRTSLANRFLTAEELSGVGAEPTYPLRVGFCHSCGHVQLLDRVPPREMFDDYLYVSSASDTLRAHFDELSETLVRRHQLQPDDLVIDVGCNDASLLGSFARFGVRTLGVDPARNLEAFARERGIDRYTGYFGAATAGEIASRWGRAALITATNTFPHIPDLDDFLVGIDRCLRRGGAFVIEAHYLLDLLEQGAWDTVYHEHVSYWALGPLVRLAGRHGMEVVRAEHLPIHHGQLRATLMRREEGRPDDSVAELLERERRARIDKFETYVAFARRVARAREELGRLLADLRAGGARVAAYGAPAKGNTLLSYLGLGPDVVEYVADRSPLKQGRYTPGTHIPVVAPERLVEDRPDYVLLLAWNFEEEVLAQQAAYRALGGRFIIPVPDVRIV